MADNHRFFPQSSLVTTRKRQLGSDKLEATSWKRQLGSDNSEATTWKRQLGSDNSEATTRKRQLVTLIGFRTYIAKRLVGTDATEKQIFSMQECYWHYNCRKTESRDSTDEFKHHSLGTNFDISIACSEFKISSVIHNFQITYIAERFVVTKHSFRIHQLTPTCFWTFPPPRSFHATREVT